jgi:peptidoglycan hydrolase-like protein with peptidoglycan-binding domain
MATNTASRRRSRRILAVSATALLVLWGTACGDGDGEVDPVEAAEARVRAAESAVSDADDAFEEAGAAFCDDAEEYIDAVDRYGKLFSESATTVGDVTTAADDLAEPRRAVESSAEDVTTAREDVAEANQELVEANAALATAQSSTTVEATTTTAPPPPDPATVDRVTAAEDDLGAAAGGISDDTPLVDATASLNAAAFALEVAWLRLFAEAGCLTSEQLADAVSAVADYTSALQSQLQVAGFYDGEIDGVYGPSTVAAVEALQTDAGLPVTGFVDEATAVALSEAVSGVSGAAASEAVVHTAAVQSALKLAGYWPGAVDGEWTPELTEALQALQTDLGVEPTGEVDTATLRALESAIEAATEPDTTTTSAVDETTTTTSG